MINIKMQPTDVQSLTPKITVIGVGGAGGNAVNNMISSALDGCEFLVCNTDAQALGRSMCENRIQLGVNVTGGLGAGSKPQIGQAAAEESIEEVMQYMEGSNMVFVTAGMGGGTGTGAAPVIAKACRERGILTVGVITKPFHFEGGHRMKMAEEGIEQMQEYVDTLIVVPNQNLFRIANENTTFSEAFCMADGVLQSGVRGVTDLMVRPGLVNLDFADIRTAMMEMGKAMMGTGEASGDKRAIEAAEAAINNPLLDDVSMKGAHGVIINVTGGYDMTLFEADEACNRIRDEVDPEANIIFGATFDDNMDGMMRVSIVATGIDKEAVSSSTKSVTGSRTMLERAKPNTNMRESAAASSSSFVASAPVMPAHDARTAPVSPARPSAAQPDMASDPEADMFELQRFSEGSSDAAHGAAASVPQNTALRGERYKDAFIPPKPVIAEGSASPVASAPVSGFHVAPSRVAQALPVAPAPVAPISSPYATAPVAPPLAQGTASALNLNPPKAPNPEAVVKRTPSLFERISGSVQHRLEGVMGTNEAETHAPRQRTAPPAAPVAPQQAPATGNLPAPRLSQGSLNIDSPAGQSRSSAAEGELDIPAFLRRQAN